MTPWDTLPNAKRIDGVLEFVRNNPNAPWDAARDAARDAAWNAAWNAAWDAARDAARVAARDAARDAAWVAARDAARDAAWVAVTALVAFDYAGELYDADISVVELAAHAGDPAAILILPLLRVMYHTKDKA